MRADEQRRVPVPAFRLFARCRLRANHQLFVVAAILAVEHALLPHQVHQVGIARVEGHAVAVGPQRHVPVLVANAVGVPGARRPVQGAEVLGAAEDVVEGFPVVQRDLVELGDRQIGEMPPGLAFVETFVSPAVGAHQQMATVPGVDPKRVVVAVFVVAGLEDLEGFAAVAGDPQKDVHLVDPVRVDGRRFDLLVVMRPGAAGDVGIAFLPTFAAVARAVKAAVFGVGFEGGVNQGGVGGGHRQADFAHGPGRQPGFEPLPGFAAIVRFVDPGAHTLAEETPNVTPPFVGGGVHHIRVSRIEFEVGGAGIFVDRQHRRPSDPAVGAAVNAPLPAGGPQRPFSGHQHPLRIARVDQNPANVLRAGQAHSLEGAAGVKTAINPIAPAHMPPADVFAGAHPQDVGIRRVERQSADRIRRLLLENRREGDAAVSGFEYPAGTDRHVEGRGLGRVHHDVGDAATHQGRPNAPEGQRRQRGRQRRRFLRGRTGGLSGAGPKADESHRDKEEDEVFAHAVEYKAPSLRL